MLDIEPKSLVFRDIRLNEAYTSNLVLSNPLSTHVSVSLRASAPSRYIIAPNQINLHPGQSVVVTVRLHVSHFPAYEKGVRGQEDNIQISSSFFEQKVSTTLFLKKRSGNDTSEFTGESQSISYHGGQNVTSRSEEPDISRHRKFVKTMQKNASYAAATAAGKRSSDQVISELQSAIHSRDNMIEKLQSIISKLEEKHPNFHVIIKERVDLEKANFEEKSQKVLEVLQKKDLQLENLQTQLDDALNREQRLENEVQKLQDKHSLSAEREINRQNQSSNRYEEELRRRIGSLEEENLSLRSSVEHLEESLKEERLNNMSSSRNIDGSTIPHSAAASGLSKVLEERLSSREKELESFREQNADQAEQIEVLISEVSKLRAEAEANQERYEHNEQYIRTISDQRECDAERLAQAEKLQSKVDTLEEELRDCNERYTDIYNYNRMLEIQLEDSVNPQSTSHDGNAGSNVEIGASPGRNANNLLELYRERAQEAEEELKNLREVFEQAQETERLTSSDVAEMEERKKRLVENEYALQKKADALRSREIVLEEKELTFKHLMSGDGAVEFKEDFKSPNASKKSAPKPSAATLGNRPANEMFSDTELDDANTWWSYVWHELKKGRQSNQHLSNLHQSKVADESFAENSDADESCSSDPLGIWSDAPTEEVERGGKEEVKDNELFSKKAKVSRPPVIPKNSQIERLRNVMRSQSIEITTLRQAKLLTEMQHKKEISSINESLEMSNREIRKLQAYNRNHRCDKETRIAEMTSTIKSLSARSDLHAQVAIAHQELESERLTVSSLRNDIESYREMLQHEKERMESLQREHEKTKAALSANLIAKSLVSVPGLNPCALIELFSGRLMWLQNELMKAKATASTLSMLGQGTSQSPSSTHRKGSSSTSPASFDSEQGTSALHGLHDHISGREPDHWQRELLQRATKPEKLLKSLDTVLLARKANEQSMTILELRKRVDDLEAALTSSTVRDHMVGISTSVGEGEDHLDRFGERARIEKHAAVRRLGLCQENLKQAEDEVQKMRQRVAFAESTLSDFKKKLDECSASICVVCTGKMKKSQSDGSQSDSDDNSSGTDENSEKLQSGPLFFSSNDGSPRDKDELRHLLQERTTQLKIMMETMEALQHGGMMGKVDLSHHGLADTTFNFGSSEESSDRDDHFDNRDPPGKHMPQWEARALVKRVVELTAETSAKCSALSMTERQVKQLESDKYCCLKEINKLHSTVHKMEKNALKLQKKYSSCLLNLNRVEKLRAEEAKESEARFDDMLKLIRERENECQELRLQSDELQLQMELADRSSFQKWFHENVFKEPLFVEEGEEERKIKEEGINVNEGQEVITTNGPDNSVRNLIVNLLLQWRDQKGFYPRGATGPISKAEQKYLQRITDMVMDAHDRAALADKDSRVCKNNSIVADRKVKTLTKRLETAMLHLFHYRCRAEAAERLSVSASRLKLNTEGGLASLLRKSVRGLSNELASLSNSFMHEKARAAEMAVDLKYTKSANAKLMQKVADLESKGSVYSQARQEALECMDGKIYDADKQLQKWFKEEIPRLLTGLPINESDYGEYDLNDAFRALGLDEKYGNSIEQSHGHEQSHPYALLQALCTAKSTQNKLESMVHSLNDKNSALRQRVVELTGVISRWKDSFKDTGDTAEHNVKEMPISKRNFDEAIESELSHRKTIEEMRLRIVELEEEVAASNGQVAHLEEREIGFRELVDVLRRSESDLKHRAAVQASRVKEEGEERHIQELRELREAYEQEKRVLMQELEEVSAALLAATADDVIKKEPPKTEIDSFHQSQRRVSTPIDIRREKFPSDAVAHVETHHRYETVLDKNSTTGDQNINAQVHMCENPNNSAAKVSSLANSPQSPSSLEISSQSSHPNQNDYQSNPDDKSSAQESNFHENDHYAEYSDATLSFAAGSDYVAGNSSFTVEDKSKTFKDHKEKSVSSLDEDSASKSPVYSDSSTITAETDPEARKSAPKFDRSRSLPGKMEDKQARNKVQELERLLSLEKERCRQSRDQVSELEQLLESQRDAFQRHLSMERDMAENMNQTISTASAYSTPARKDHSTQVNSSYVSGLSIPTGENERSHLPPTSQDHSYSMQGFDVPSMPFDHQAGLLYDSEEGQQANISPSDSRDNLSRQHGLMSVSKEVSAEDPALWPPIATMSNQLKGVLQEAITHINSVAKDMGMQESARGQALGHNKSEYTYMKGALYKNRLLSLLHESSVLSERLHRASKAPVVEERFLGFSDDKSEQKPLRSTLDPKSEVGTHLEGALARVNSLEDVLASDECRYNIPESYVSLLKELRGRMLHLDEVIQEELRDREKAWQGEKEQLLQQLQDSQQEIDSMSAMSNDGLEMIKKRYENALREAQDALSEQSASYAKQIEFLEQELRNSKQSASETTKDISIETDSGNVSGHIHLQRLLDAAGDDIDKYRNDLKVASEKHTTEMKQMQQHFEKYRKAQDHIVTSLEEQISQLEKEIRIDRIKHAAKLDESEMHSNDADSLESLTEIFGCDSVTPSEGEAALREIAFRVKIKRAELDAVLRALSEAGAGVSSEGEGRPVSSRTPTEELLEARLSAAEKELEQVHRLAAREKSRGATTSKAVTFAEDQAGESGKRSVNQQASSLKEKSKGKTKTDAMISSRKAFAKELDELKAKKSQLEETSASHKAEVTKLKHIIADLKDQVSSLREDNSRKSKLLSAIRASKTQDDNALEQWRHEVSESEEKLKRANRSISSKEGVIRDLKAKLEQQESELRRKSEQLAEFSVVESKTGESSSWSMKELRNRYKESELEKSRMRQRVTASKDRIKELERQIESLKAEVEKHKAVVDKTDAMKLAIARKDSMIKNQREQLEQLRVEHQSTQEIASSRKVDADKQIRSMQKQVDTIDSRNRDLLKEKDELRDRYENEIKNLTEECANLRSLLKETSRELENRFYYQPHESAATDKVEAKTEDSHNARSWSRSQQHRSSSNDSHLDAPHSNRSNSVSSGRVAVMSELNSIMEELGDFDESVRVSRDAVLSSSDTEDDRSYHRQYRRGREKRHVEHSREKVSVSSRLLQETEAELSDSPQGESRPSRRSFRSQPAGRHHSEIKRSPESDQNSTGSSDVMSVEYRLKGLIRAALKEDES